MKFEDLGCNINEDIIVVNFNGQDIEVKQYLSSKEKEDIINAVLQNADAGTVVDTFAEEVLFNTYLVFEYTNIEFSEEDKQNNIYEIYDKLLCSGLLDKIIQTIPKEEYDTLFNNVEKIHNEYLGYRDSARAAFEQMSIFTSSTPEELGEKVNNFNVEKFKEINNVANQFGINN